MIATDLAGGGETAGRAIPVARPIKVPADNRPQLFVVVDTEEEFDWSAPYSRANTSVTAMQHVHRAQRVFDRFAVRPTYVIDYPVASQPAGFEPLREIAQAGRCHIGAHLHPWVNPPYDEEVNTRNSFTMNLPPALQRAKVTALHDMVYEHFGARPQVFKAGRYGLGAATVPILEDLGFEVDNSVSPAMDFSGEGGPDYSSYSSQPFFITSRLLEVPCTIAYSGWAGGFGRQLHGLASAPALSKLRMVGLLARARAVNKIMLSPEGNTFDEMKRLAADLYRRGCRTFTLTFHSPSVAPGHTPYVRSRADLDAFLGDIERFLEFFFTELHGVAGTVLDFRASLHARVESH